MYHPVYVTLGNQTKDLVHARQALYPLSHRLTIGL